MNFIKSAMASIGIGSAKIDTILNSRIVQPGCEVKGYVKIQGGEVEQRIDNIYLNVCTEYEKESDDKKYNVKETIQKITIPINKTIETKEKLEIPFSFILSNKTPVSMGNSFVWISSQLDIKMAIDPKDGDDLSVNPHPNMDVILRGIHKLGFKLRKVKNDYSRYNSEVNFIQNFEFIPMNNFRGKLDEIEVGFFMKNSSIDLLIQIDRKAKGLGGLLLDHFDLDENLVRISINENDLKQGEDHISSLLYNLISRYAG